MSALTTKVQNFMCDVLVGIEDSNVLVAARLLDTGKLFATKWVTHPS